MRIGLLTTLNTNIGDDFIREGLRDVVSRILVGTKIRWVLINKHEPHTVYPHWHPIRFSYRDGFRPRPRLGPLRWRAERWLPPLGFSRFDGCDLVIQCGTPVIWDGCRHSEWARMIWLDVLARLGRGGKPVLNLGGGSCYPWERQPPTLVGHADEPFVRAMLRAARITTVRDTLAQNLFLTLGHQVERYVCPAFLAGQVFTTAVAPTRKVLINYMKGAGHYDWDQHIDAAVWENTMQRVVSSLQQAGWIVAMLAHNQAEFDLASRLWPTLPRFLPRSLPQYFLLIRDAAFGVFNRLHAAVAAAGLGIPSVSIGTDTRMLMVREAGLPVLYVKEATAERILETVDEILRGGHALRTRLLQLRAQTFKSYETLLRSVLDR